MATFVRGSNPVWFYVDLQANPFDDTFYMYVLENTIPYLPSPVYHDPNGAIPWTDPIQFLANGTLPIDIYFDPAKVYRLEFRENVGPLPPSQSDPLIYLVENYMPGAGGNVPPVDVIGPFTENQITNPQFALVDFAPSLVLSSVALTPADPIQVAPGWELLLSGTGSLTMTQEPLNSATPNPTNAPYALRLQLSGWTDPPILRQRFQQAGMLWANKYVASSVTARAAATATISAQLVNSMGATIATVLTAAVGVISTSFNEFTDFALLPATTNTDVPPNAYIDYQMILPTTVDIYLTSFQLIASDTPSRFGYEQDTVDRQLDHTFHYYQNSLIMQPKDSIAVGWDFGLNPYQFTSTLQTTVALNEYTLDQTIVIQQQYVANNIGSNVATVRGAAIDNTALGVRALTANSQFGLLQYIDARSMAAFWNLKVSSLVRARLQTVNATTVRFKMRLIANPAVPSLTTRTYPVATWTLGQDPVFNAAFTVLTPLNDPIYTLDSTFDEFSFNQFDLSDYAASTSLDTLGIFIYTLDPIVTTGTPDTIYFDSISLVPNDFAIGSNSLTWDETLRQCEYYFEKSYVNGQLFPPFFPPQLNAGGAIINLMRVVTGGGTVPIFINPLHFQFRTVKRAVPAAGKIVTYSNIDGLADRVQIQGINNGAVVVSASHTVIGGGNWATFDANTKEVFYLAVLNTAIDTIGAPAAGNTYAIAAYHYTVDTTIGS